MDVGVRELKARLSEYLDRAERGEVITVTEHGRPKAIVAPLPGTVRLAEGIAQGWIAAPSGSRLGAARRHVATRKILDVLTEDRGS